MSADQFLTIAGRWNKALKDSGLEMVAPKSDQAKLMLMFYAGFSACLEATVEISDMPEVEAVRLLECLHQEVKLIANLGDALQRRAQN